MIITFDYRDDGGFSIKTDDQRAKEILRDCNLISVYDPLTPNTYLVLGAKPNTVKAVRLLKQLMDEK